MPDSGGVETPQWLWVRLRGGRVERRVLLEEEPGRFRLARSLPGQQEMFSDGQGSLSLNGNGQEGGDAVDPYRDERKETGKGM